jgi:hypothetical protein
LFFDEARAERVAVTQLYTCHLTDEQGGRRPEAIELQVVHRLCFEADKDEHGEASGAGVRAGLISGWEVEWDQGVLERARVGVGQAEQVPVLEPDTNMVRESQDEVKIE